MAGKKIAFIILLFVSSFVVNGLAQTNADQIELNYIKKFFTRLKSEKIDAKEELRWTYTYTDTIEANLTKLAAIFVRENLKIEGIERSTKPNNKYYVLHASEVKQHTPESLQARMHILNQLADLYGIMYHDAQFGAENIKKVKNVDSYKKVRG